MAKKPAKRRARFEEDVHLVGVRIPESDYKKLEAAAKSKNIPVSAIVRNATDALFFKRKKGLYDYVEDAPKSKPKGNAKKKAAPKKKAPAKKAADKQ